MWASTLNPIHMPSLPPGLWAGKAKAFPRHPQSGSLLLSFIASLVAISLEAVMILHNKSEVEGGVAHAGEVRSHASGSEASGQQREHWMCPKT